MSLQTHVSRAQKSIRRHWTLWGEHILNSKSFFVKLPQDRSYYKTSGESKHQKWASIPCILFSFLEGTPSLLYKIKSNLGPMAMSDKRKMATNVLFFSQRKKMLFFSQRKKCFFFHNEKNNKILLLDISAVFFISFKLQRALWKKKCSNSKRVKIALSEYLIFGSTKLLFSFHHSWVKTQAT